jgi:hypothetical protein
MLRTGARAGGLRKRCAQSPERWEPQLTTELRESCKKAPLECRQAAETLAAGWTTDDEAFGALRAFAAACQGGDAKSCGVIDRRFTQVRSLSERPVPEYPKAARDKRLQGTSAATCTFTRTGVVTSCTVERPVPELDGPFLAWIREEPYQAATLDGRSFGCEYRLEFRLSIGPG